MCGVRTNDEVWQMRHYEDIKTDHSSSFYHIIRYIHIQFIFFAVIQSSIHPIRCIT
jgi:hypothetical protein